MWDINNQPHLLSLGWCLWNILLLKGKGSSKQNPQSKSEEGEKSILGCDEGFQENILTQESYLSSADRHKTKSYNRTLRAGLTLF